MSNVQIQPKLSKNQRRKANLAEKVKALANPGGNNIISLEKQLQSLKTQFDLSSANKALMEYKAGGDFTNNINTIDSQYILKAKLRKLEVLVGRKFAISELSRVNENFDKLTSQQKIHYLEAIYADDLWSALGVAAGEVAPVLGQLAKAYGPAVLNWLYEAGSNVYRKVFSKGSGHGLLSYPNSVGGDLPPLRRGNPIYPCLVDSNTVDKKYLAALFCPESYKELTPDQFNSQLVNTCKTSTIPIVTGSDGNALVYFLPDALMQAGTGVTAWSTAQNGGIGGTTNVIGGIPSSYSYTAGPYNAGTNTNYARFRATQGSTRIVFNEASNTNQGVCTLSYTSDPPIGATFGVSAPVITQEETLQFPFLHIAQIAGTKEMRQIHLPHDVTELALEDFDTTMINQQANGGYDLLYVSIEGAYNGTAGTGTQIGKIYQVAAMDYAPGPALIGSVLTESTPDAPGSIPCAASIIKRAPHVCQLTLDEAQELAEMILSIQSNEYGHISSEVVAYLSKYKARPKLAIGGNGGGIQKSFMIEDSFSM